MTVNTEHAENDQFDSDGESDVIRALRQQVKDLKAREKEATSSAQDALATARAQVKREMDASTLMSNAGFAGLADIFAGEVDGDLTQEAVVEWLSKRGLEASPGTEEEEGSPARQVSEVADLAAQVASASQDPTHAAFGRKVDEAEASAGNLDDFLASLESIVEG